MMTSVMTTESAGGGTVGSGTGRVESVGGAAESVGAGARESLGALTVVSLGTAVESTGRAASAEGLNPSPLHAAPVARRKLPAIARRHALRTGGVRRRSISVASP